MSRRKTSDVMHFKNNILLLVYGITLFVKEVSIRNEIIKGTIREVLTS